MKKNILKVYFRSVMLSVWFLAFLSLSMFIYAVVIYDSSRDTLWSIVIASALLLFGSTYFITTALYMTQRAEISEYGITIYSIFFSKIKIIKWNELVDLRTKSVVTFSSAYGSRSSKDWIVLYTDFSQKEKVHNLMNRKKKGPWYISCTKENLNILTEYVIKYAPHICDDPNVFF